MSSFQPTPHPVLPVPTLEQAWEWGEKKWREVMAQREALIQKGAEDRLYHGWQPPIWRVCDALLGLPWVNADWAEQLRRSLGFRWPVDILLILGGQRSGKTDYMLSRTMRTLRMVNKRAWVFHQDMDMSITYHQGPMFDLLPPELRVKDIRSREAYIAFKRKTGFSEGAFRLPNRSECNFRTYDQDVKKIEGGEVDLIAADELLPPEHLRTLELRIATRNGKILVGFTPVQGFTETVRMLVAGAEVVRSSTAFLLPRDTGEPDVARALGLSEAELAEAREAMAAKPPRASWSPAARPEDCDAWLAEHAAGVEGAEVQSSKFKVQRLSQPAVPEDRLFEQVPRVLKCADPSEKRAVVYFHSSDNPFGNPWNVWNIIRTRDRNFQRERFYGIASKLFAARFGTFNVDVHVVPDEAVPKDGTNYHFFDPAQARNPFQTWIRCTPLGDYVYREWPGSYYIPGVGIPGPWAYGDGKLHDGRMGPGAVSFGFSYWRIKQEIGRLERWPDAMKQKPENMDEREWVESWNERSYEPAKGQVSEQEIIHRRIIDSRAASAPKEHNDRPVTLLTQMDKLGLTFQPAPGDDIDEGCKDIEDALYYDANRPVEGSNRPRLFIAASCKNTIFALQTWTGLDGQKGATKDPIDNLRYKFRDGCRHVTAADLAGDEGGHY